jgi:SAM-dependent methyltransferase
MNMNENTIDQYKRLHSDNLRFGASSIAYIEEVSLFIEYLKPKTVLDYGCGKGALIDELAARFPDIDFYGYDPAIPGKDVLPVQQADLIINTDVLEHIPENALPDIIQKISLISENVFFGLHHALAKQILPNGQNAHCTVKPPVWYYRLLSKSFNPVLLLDGHKIYQSVAITFPVTPKIIVEYYDLLKMPLCDTLVKRLTCWARWRLKRTRKKLKRGWKKFKDR